MDGNLSETIEGSVPETAPAVSSVEASTVQTPSTETVVPAVVVEPAAPAPVETAPAADAPQLHTDTATLLEGIGKEAEAAPADAAPAVEVVTPATYQPFELPEGLSADPKQMEAFTEIAAKTGLDQETAQSLVSMHASALATMQQQMAADQHRVFADTRAQWVNQVKADPDMGGAAFETSMKAVARARDRLVPAERREAFENFLRVTGAGDHPEFLRILHTASRLLDEPAPPPVAVKPLANGGMKGGKQSFRNTLYTHPSSQRAMNG